MNLSGWSGNSLLRKIPLSSLPRYKDTNYSQSDYVPQERYSGRWKVTLTCFIIHFVSVLLLYYSSPFPGLFICLSLLLSIIFFYICCCWFLSLTFSSNISSSTSVWFSGEVQITKQSGTDPEPPPSVSMLFSKAVTHWSPFHCSTVAVHWLAENFGEAKLVFKMNRRTLQNGRKREHFNDQIIELLSTRWLLIISDKNEWVCVTRCY